MYDKFSEDLFLTNDTAKRLFNDYAKDMPIIDYHCHLLPQEIYEDRIFSDLGEMWLAGDHYKWRAMRTFGIEEKYITGSETDFHEKYLKFAEILPLMAGNPIYIWCALELKRFFGIDEAISAANAEEIYQRTKKIISEKNMTRRYCMNISGVETVCTTDDPVDSLEYHVKLREDSGFKVNVVPAFRPDNALYIERPAFAAYAGQLAEVTGLETDSFASLIKALENRMVFFKSQGAFVSDSGIDYFEWIEGCPAEIEKIYTKALSGEELSFDDIHKYRTAFVTEMARVYNRQNIVMQLHVGTYLDANTVQKQALGASTGFDCTDDRTQVRSVGFLLDKLTVLDELPRVILYPLNAGLTENFAILAAAFCGGGIKARVQLGAAWWFNDQEYGIRRQFQATANLYPLSLSVGMLTDSRSFLSYPRHELFRRVLCNYLGELIERGEYFSDENAQKSVIQNLCYYNAKEFFGL